MQRAAPDDERKVFLSHRESVCGECHENLGRGAWVELAGDKGVLCLSCAELDDLEFLEPGDAALTRRARKYSTRSAVVLEWSRSRKRYERQGLLVEAEALEKAEAECLADAEVRARRQLRASGRRAVLDEKYVEAFASAVRRMFPNCPRGRERIIAEHACQKYGGRVGRSSAAKALDEDAVRLAVIAHVRHRETEYDLLLARGVDRHEARSLAAGAIDAVLDRWSGGAG